DYTSNGSIQIHLFRDRLEIINPGALPLGWSEERLKKPHTSIPFNPLLAEPMYLKGYIERMGTGTLDIVRIAKEFDLKEPVFLQEEYFKIIIFRPTAVEVEGVNPTSTPQVPHKYTASSVGVPQEFRRSTVEVRNLLKALGNSGMSRKEIQQVLGLKHEGNFRENYLEPAIKLGLIEMKYPDSPNHPRQKYLITKKGKELLDDL
ncbi:transcriptional regulator, partial [bacterium]|nr:transcriptional regulator [bacterium]